MLIHSKDIDRAMFNVSQALNIDREVYFQKAKGELDYSNGIYGDREEREDVFDILDVLPKALNKVKSESFGLLALTTWEDWQPKDKNYYLNLSKMLDIFTPKIQSVMREEINRELNKYSSE